MDVERLIEVLGRASTWGHHPGEEPPSLLQTHISVLVFAGTRVFKFKKPVDLGFLDYSTLARRRICCDEEVRLNRRLAPDLYLGVVPLVAEGADDYSVGQPGEQPDQVVEWAVCMRRLPAERMLEALLDAGEIDNARVEELATVLARFHDQAGRGPQGEHGTMAEVEQNVRENFEQLGAFAEELGAVQVLDHLEARALSFLAQERELFERREAGHVREGHGDLHASNVCFAPDGLVIYDCVEFSPRLRWGDVACDLAFLTMDLDRRGFGAFGRYLARRYAQLAGDPELGAVLGFYESYRALVRAKVSAFSAAQVEAGPDLRAAKREEALGYLALAGRQGLAPALLLTCGLPASGKSTTARHLARRLNAAHLSSDVRRKRLAGLHPDRRAAADYGQGLYSAEGKARTYASLLESTREILAGDRSVIVDASFALASDRAQFLRVAAELGVPALLLWVTADEDETRRRMTARATDGSEASDADLAVWERARADFEPPSEGEGRLLRLASPGQSLEEQALVVVSSRIGF